MRHGFERAASERENTNTNIVASAKRFGAAMAFGKASLFKLLGIQDLLGGLPVGIQQADKFVNGQFINGRNGGCPEILQQ